ncbi:hypothetical protein HQ584_11055 [Patescibacteria group bacterium]|nr:hypothetical protein [Patescibacteria group bacterium]
MEESLASQSVEESLRKVDEGKLSPCLEIIYNARIPTYQALRIIGEGMNAAAQATHLKPKYHRIYSKFPGHVAFGVPFSPIGVMLEFPGKAMARRIVTINIDFTNRFISEMRDQINSLGMQILTAKDVKTKSLFKNKEKGNQVGLYISSRFLPSYKYQAKKKITKRVFKIGKDEFMLVHDRSYDC